MKRFWREYFYQFNVEGEIDFMTIFIGILMLWTLPIFIIKYNLES